MRNGKELVSDNEIYRIFSGRFGNQHLEIPLASEKDEGPYQIIASNDYGTSVHEFYLQQADPPVFLEPFKDVTVKNNEDVTIMCKVDGIPYPEVKFYKDWHLLAESYRIRIKYTEPDMWVITIRGAIVKDSGLYTCTAKNIAGATLSSCNVSVLDSLLHRSHPELKTDLVTFKQKKFEEDYEIVEEISASVNSKVYRVIDRHTAKEYLAKIVYKPEYDRWIRDEADCLNQVRKSYESNVVKLHDAYETPNKMSILIFHEIKTKNILESMLTTDNAPNETSKGVLEERKVAIYMKQLLECLNVLHSRNIVHLDINTDNVIIDEATKRIKLIGFTHSKCLKPGAFSNKAYEKVFYHDYGKPEFVSPEVIKNEPITLNTDMWSTGVLAYQLLTGKSPFFGKDSYEILKKISKCEWSFDNNADISLSHEAKDFIQHLFAVNPKERMTAEQALQHPWIQYSAQHSVASNSLNNKDLIELHSRQVWSKKMEQQEVWRKLVPISCILSMPPQQIERELASSYAISEKTYNLELKLITEQATMGDLKFELDKLDKTEPYDEQNELNQLYGHGDDDDEMNPGSYLVPVKDPLFTVRLREYRRTRFERVQQITNDLKDKQINRSKQMSEVSSRVTSPLKRPPPPQQQITKPKLSMEQVVEAAMKQSMRKERPDLVATATATASTTTTKSIEIVKASTSQQEQKAKPLARWQRIAQEVESKRLAKEEEEKRVALEAEKNPIRKSFVGSMNEIRNYTRNTIKERYKVDVYGKLIQRGSLSRSSSLLKSSRLSASPTGSVGSGAGGSVGSLNDQRAGSVTQQGFQQFIDYRYDKRQLLLGEGLSPIIREKLKDLYLLVGSTVTLRCRIEGQPSPRCFWYHNDRLIIGDDDRYKFSQAEDGSNSLTISKARVSDIGVYRCVARNRYGVSLTRSKLTVGDTPDRPSRPIVAQHSNSEVYLIWESPAFNGNSDILSYKVDYKLSNDVKWINALYTIEECCLIKNLAPLSNYRFRVSCINNIGISAYSWASEEITTLSSSDQTKIIIDNEQIQKLLKNQYNLEKRSEQSGLIKKLYNELDDTSKKKLDGTLERFKLDNKKAEEFYIVSTDKIYANDNVSVHYATDKANGTKRIIKFYSGKMNDNELKLLRELRDENRFIELIEGFQIDNKTTFVYSHAITIIDFISIRHKYSEELVVKILRQLLDALQWIHLHGYVHLNIHPLTILNSNLMQVNIKLSGFENSSHLSELTQTTSSKTSSPNKILMPLEFSCNFNSSHLFKF
jgi:serine/threonine protein kinase